MKLGGIFLETWRMESTGMTFWWINIYCWIIRREKKMTRGIPTRHQSRSHRRNYCRSTWNSTNSKHLTRFPAGILNWMWRHGWTKGILLIRISRSRRSRRTFAGIKYKTILCRRSFRRTITRKQLDFSRELLHLHQSLTTNSSAGSTISIFH